MSTKSLKSTARETCLTARSPPVGLNDATTKDEVLQLDLVNFTLPLREAATPVTSEPDRPAGPKP